MDSPFNVLPGAKGSSCGDVRKDGRFPAARGRICFLPREMQAQYNPYHYEYGVDRLMREAQENAQFFYPRNRWGPRQAGSVAITAMMALSQVCCRDPCWQIKHCDDTGSSGEIIQDAVEAAADDDAGVMPWPGKLLHDGTLDVENDARLLVGLHFEGTTDR